MPRFIIIVLDSFGVGELPDADRFDDRGTHTFKHIAEQVPDLRIPNMTLLGLQNIDGVGLPPIAHPTGCFGKCTERSNGKDTTTGHFEIAGLIVDKPYPVFGEAFPDRIISELERHIGTKVIGNYPASGTEIIQVLGDEHVRTGFPIVYLSADSLMQIAMHESVIPLPRQYEICRIARELMTGDDMVSRIICRPFVGTSGQYKRTENRRDFAVDPPGRTVLDALKEAGREVIAVGKIEDIFNRVGITRVDHTKNNREGIAATLGWLDHPFDGLLFVNLVDFDMLYGHRNDPEGYARALEYFDDYLPALTGRLKEDDILVITADHGCDPTTKGTDHTREYTPLLVTGPRVRKGIDLGVRDTFADIAATVADFFQIEFPTGKSFLSDVVKV